MNKIILFDGVCNFCNFWVKFAIKRDKNKVLTFCSLQSETGIKLSKKFNIDTSILQSVIFIDDNKIYTHSNAALRICKYLNGGWRLFYLLIFIPKPFRDFIYNVIGKNRYAWFGKSDTCMIPDPTLKERFL